MWIVGIISKNSSFAEKVDLMEQLSLKSGPDNQSPINYSNGAPLVHTRLFIIDLDERSNQPLTDEESGDQIAFIDDIYFYIDH